MSADHRARSGWRWLDRLVIVGVVATAITFVLGELGRLDWRLELLSHFAVQYTIALAVAGVYFLIRGRALWLVVAVVIGLMPAWRIASYLPIGGASTHAAGGTHSLRVMTINVHAGNARYEDVRVEIERLDPDIVFVPENTDRWAAGLAPLRAGYPYVVDGKSESVFSLFLFSRVPLSQSSIVTLPQPDGFPAIVTRACAEGADNDMACVRVIGMHPPPPLTADLASQRDAALQAIPQLVAGEDVARTIVLGDFNCTPWSPLFRDLLTATGLRDAALATGLAPTWLSRWLPFGLTIDHILVGEAIDVSRHDVGNDVGSDHFPVVADLRF
jgi:endonuclease/exonuclease/phosphatase (EEP) superfamily protein YafD